ncbi:MAG: GNAT family N-acetyltransferase [Anaerolineales bacterium]|nr:GNAT family N-acetyltransferase [Anaerolineales bacterium]
MDDRFYIRPMTTDDVPRLADMNPGFVSETALHVERIGEGYQVGWRLVEVQLPEPYDKGHGYDFNFSEQENILGRLRQPDALEQVVIDSQTDQIVGVLDAAIEEWRRVLWIWNIMMDVSVRGRGIGRRLVENSIAWAERYRLRAVMLETQTNNAPACRFYARMGFQLVGINQVFYTNHDIERGEVALFWSYPIQYQSRREW